MRLQEGPYLPHRQRDPLLGLLPREHAYLGFRREHRGLHGDCVGMCRDIIGEYQHGRLAITHETACHGPNEVRISAVELVDCVMVMSGRRLTNSGPQPVLDRFALVIPSPPCSSAGERMACLRHRRHVNSSAHQP